MVYDLFFTPKVQDIQIGATFDPILGWRQNKGLGMGHNITILKNWPHKWITNLGKTSYWICYFYHSWSIVYKFGHVLAQCLLYDVTRIVTFPNFRKMMEDQIFDLKKYTWFQVYNFLVLFGHDILLWNCFKNLGKWRQRGAPVSHLPPNILQKF